MCQAHTQCGRHRFAIPCSGGPHGLRTQDGSHSLNTRQKGCSLFFFLLSIFLMIPVEVWRHVNRPTGRQWLSPFQSPHRGSSPCVCVCVLCVCVHAHLCGEKAGEVLSSKHQHDAWPVGHSCMQLRLYRDANGPAQVFAKEPRHHTTISVHIIHGTVNTAHCAL